VAITLSARSGEGIELLRQELLRIAGWHPAEDVFIARERHLRALAKPARTSTPLGAIAGWTSSPKNSGWPSWH
jgi:tRNA U34 5-carboxymethylaminomethyl modifying GTPase MnmE/TrmE